MSKCKGCGKTFRKGKAVVLMKDGLLIPIIGCPECIRRSVRLVAPTGDAANLCACGKEPARIGEACALKARMALIAPVLASLSGLAKAAELNGQGERAEALKGAMRALELEAEKS